MTILRPLFSISYNFLYFHRNKFLILHLWNLSKFLSHSFKEMPKVSFNTFRIIMVKCDEIWFPWQYWEACSGYHAGKTTLVALSHLFIRPWWYRASQCEMCTQFTLSRENIVGDLIVFRNWPMAKLCCHKSMYMYEEWIASNLKPQQFNMEIWKFLHR